MAFDTTKPQDFCHIMATAGIGDVLASAGFVHLQHQRKYASWNATCLTLSHTMLQGSLASRGFAWGL